MLSQKHSVASDARLRHDSGSDTESDGPRFRPMFNQIALRIAFDSVETYLNMTQTMLSRFNAECYSTLLAS